MLAGMNSRRTAIATARSVYAPPPTVCRQVSQWPQPTLGLDGADGQSAMTYDPDRPVWRWPVGLTNQLHVRCA